MGLLDPPALTATPTGVVGRRGSASAPALRDFVHVHDFKPTAGQTVYVGDGVIAPGTLTQVTSPTAPFAVGDLVTAYNVGAYTQVGTLQAALAANAVLTPSAVLTVGNISQTAGLGVNVYYGPILVIDGSNVAVIPCVGAQVASTSLVVQASGYTMPNHTFPVGSILAYPANFGATITSVSGTTATLNASATLPNPLGTTLQLAVGVDDTAAITAGLAYLAANGGGTLRGHGIHTVTSQITVPGGCTLVGDAWDYQAPGTGGGSYLPSGAPVNPTQGFVIRAHPTISSSAPMVQLGSIPNPNSGWGNAGQTGATAERVAFDGTGVAQSALKTYGVRCIVEKCEVRNGSTYALDLSGQNTRVMNTVADNASQGTGCVNFGAADLKWEGGEIRPGGTCELYLSTGEGLQLHGCDIFGNSGRQDVNDVILIAPPAATSATAYTMDVGQISGCSVDSSSAAGSIVHVQPGAYCTVNNFGFNDNHVYQENVSISNQLVLIDVTATGSAFNQFTFNDNNVSWGGAGGNALSGGGYAQLVALHSSVGSVPGSVMVGNTISGIKGTLFGGGFKPVRLSSTVWQSAASATYGTWFQTEQTGSAVASGTGSVMTVTIPHAIGSIPGQVILGETSVAAVAAQPWVSSKTATNFVVSFQNIPATGTGNLTFDWAANA